MSNDTQIRLAQVVSTTEPFRVTQDIGPSRTLAGQAVVVTEDGEKFTFPRGSQQIPYSATTGTTGELVWRQGSGGYTGWVFVPDASAGDRFDPKLEG